MALPWQIQYKPHLDRALCTCDWRESTFQRHTVSVHQDWDAHHFICIMGLPAMLRFLFSALVVMFFLVVQENKIISRKLCSKYLQEIFD